MTEIRVITETLGGGPLAQAALARATPRNWFAPVPQGASEWKAWAHGVAASAPAGWFAALRPAFGDDIPPRLTRVAAGGVVVTTGQQPGLFGGPIYTWSKALTALTLADAIERETGIPAAPVFWAATDDSDFAEASSTLVNVAGGWRRLTLPGRNDEGVPLSQVPLEDVGPLLAALEEGAGSAVDAMPLSAARRAYASGRTVGDAYVALLRELLTPLGIAVLDASHPAVTAAARPLLQSALTSAATIHAALQRRDEEIQSAGYEAQVAVQVPLSLVFERAGSGGVRRRLPLDEAVSWTERPGNVLSPNVLLRPVVERAILPTAAYAAGPGELAYFAQVSAVAEALDVVAPLAVPRWSGTLVEPHIQSLLAQYELQPSDLRAYDDVVRRLAMAEVPQPLRARLVEAREGLLGQLDALRAALRTDPGFMSDRVVDGVQRALEWRFARLERRMVAAAKRREERLMQQLGTLRGALWPEGIRQERALNIVPILARHGTTAVLSRMVDAAAAHARALVRHDGTGGASLADTAASLSMPTGGS